MYIYIKQKLDKLSEHTKLNLMFMFLFRKCFFCVFVSSKDRCATDGEGQTPLMLASREEHQDVMRALVEEVQTKLVVTLVGRVFWLICLYEMVGKSKVVNFWFWIGNQI